MRLVVAALLMSLLPGCYAQTITNRYLDHTVVDQVFRDRSWSNPSREQIRQAVFAAINRYDTAEERQAFLVDQGGLCVDAPDGAFDCHFSSLEVVYLRISFGDCCYQALITDTRVRVGRGKLSPEAITVRTVGRSGIDLRNYYENNPRFTSVV